MFRPLWSSVANLRGSLKQAGVPVQWRAIAKDAVDVPPGEAAMRLAHQQISVGETSLHGNGPVLVVASSGIGQTPSRIVLRYAPGDRQAA